MTSYVWYVHKHTTFQIQKFQTTSPEKKNAVEKGTFVPGKKKQPFVNDNFLFDQTRNPTLQVFYHTRVSKGRGIQTPNRTVPNLNTRCGAIAWTLKEELVNYQNKHGVTPLQHVTVNDQETVTKLVIEVRCNVNLTSCFGRTPLLNVTQKGITVIVKQLIEARCNVDLQDNDGVTPLYMSVFFGHPEVTEQLIEARANLDLQHKNGYTPLMIAAYRGDVAVAKLLLGSGRGAPQRLVLDEDFYSEEEDEEEEEEEDTNDVDSVEGDEDEEEEEPLSD